MIMPTMVVKSTVQQLSIFLNTIMQIVCDWHWLLLATILTSSEGLPSIHRNQNWPKLYVIGLEQRDSVNINYQGQCLLLLLQQELVNILLKAT